MTTHDGLVRAPREAQRVAGADWSLVIPMYDEEQNVAPLLDELAGLPPDAQPAEVLVVDDASKDATAAELAGWKSRRLALGMQVTVGDPDLFDGEPRERTGFDPDRRDSTEPVPLNVRLLRLHQRSGQSAAVLAGVRHASHPIVAVMDGDMQNDPSDLAPMVARVADAGVDAVFGVRTTRHDGWVRRWSSKVGNGFRNAITGDRVRDAGCGTKVLRRELFLSLPQFVGMHRFMTTLCRYEGACVEEAEVHHRPRLAGRTKYGIGNRAWRGMVDCFAVRWLRSRRVSPAVVQER